MSKAKRTIRDAESPVSRAMVFICEKCGRRGDFEGKNASHRLASKLKRACKRRLERGEVRVALTSCMDVCPEDQITVLIQPMDGVHPARFRQADITDVDAASERLLEILMESTGEQRTFEGRWVSRAI
jgi:predicted metal-binding protein